VLRRRPNPNPVPINALINNVQDSPCNFESEFTNLAAFFKRNTNVYLTSEQQFPIDQGAWKERADCFNNILYTTDLSPKENYVVNTVN
jgi:hypothetical protein